LKNGCVWVKGVNEQNIVIKICMWKKEDILCNQYIQEQECDNGYFSDNGEERGCIWDF
jgi:hypothetical protein